MDDSQNLRKKDSLLYSFYGLFAFIFWGFASAYWHLLRSVDITEFLSHRFFWNFFLCFFYIFINGKLKDFFAAFFIGPRFFLVPLAGFILYTNWSFYNGAINNSLFVESSLGYYISPLIFVLLSTLFLKEKLNLFAKLAVLVAFIGVLVLTISYGAFPYTSVLIALTFSLYGFVKRFIPLDPIIMLTAEMFCMLPFSGYTVFSNLYFHSGDFVYGGEIITIMLLSAGVVTFLPLLFFSLAVGNISFATVGFIQYVYPTIVLILGIIFFNDPLDSRDLPGFICIWIAVILYFISGSRKFAK